MLRGFGFCLFCTVNEIDELNAAVHFIGNAGIAVVVAGGIPESLESVDDLGEVLVNGAREHGNALVIELYHAVIKLLGTAFKLAYTANELGAAGAEGTDPVVEISRTA